MATSATWPTRRPGPAASVANQEARSCRKRGQAYADHWPEIVEYHTIYPQTSIFTNVARRGRTKVNVFRRKWRETA